MREKLIKTIILQTWNKGNLQPDPNNRRAFGKDKDLWVTLQAMRKGVEVMKFKVGDKVRVKKQLISGVDYGRFLFVNSMKEYRGKVVTIHEINPQVEAYDIEEDGGEACWTDEMLEPIEEYKTDAEIMRELIEGRNNKAQSVERPTHYENNGKDLFDELYDRLFHSKKMFTGREVFIIVMKFVAERYIRRYPNKNAEDLSKGIYTLERLKEYEELEE